ncbi:hypothetical protein ABT366_10385, partial [Streptomyces lydicus]
MADTAMPGSADSADSVSSADPVDFTDQLRSTAPVPVPVPGPASAPEVPEVPPVRGFEGDDPLDRAVWRLRSRGCWDDAAALLEPHSARHASAAQRRAALLVERCMFTATGWAEAEDALRHAEALAGDDDERGGAACERG